MCNEKYSWLNYDMSGSPMDVERLVECFSQHRYHIPPRAAYEIWKEYSQSMAAGWMMLPESNEQLWNILSQYVDSGWV
jgi:hypothetical protein